MSLELHYRSLDPQVWIPRSEDAQGQFAGKVTCWSLFHSHAPTPDEPSYGILGFACDEGIRRSRGHPGAVQGPMIWRRAFARQVKHREVPVCHYYDFGDIVCEDGDLEGAQEAMAEALAIVVKRGIHTCVIGGGSELIPAHCQGVWRSLPQLKLGILHIGPTLCLSQLDGQGKGGSHTALRQALDLAKKEGKAFECLSLGMQPLSNPTTSYQYAKQYGVTSISADEWQWGGDGRVMSLIDKMLESCDAIYMTVNLGVFAAPYAFGVSAPEPLGMPPGQVLSVIRKVASSSKALAFDVVELCPPRDVNNTTANLAGIVAATYLENHTLFPLVCTV